MDRCHRNLSLQADSGRFHRVWKQRERCCGALDVREQARPFCTSCAGCCVPNLLTFLSANKVTLQADVEGASRICRASSSPLSLPRAIRYPIAPLQKPDEAGLRGGGRGRWARPGTPPCALIQRSSVSPLADSAKWESTPARPGGAGFGVALAPTYRRHAHIHSSTPIGWLASTCTSRHQSVGSLTTKTRNKRTLMLRVVFLALPYFFPFAVS